MTKSMQVYYLYFCAIIIALWSTTMVHSWPQHRKTSNTNQRTDSGYFINHRQSGRSSSDFTFPDEFEDIMSTIHIPNKDRIDGNNNKENDEPAFINYTPPPKFKIPSDPDAIIFVDELQSAKFSYKSNNLQGPSNWNEIAESCGGLQQSPIALDSLMCQQASINSDSSLVMGLQYQVPKTVTITNNGHSIDYLFTWPEDGPPYIMGGPLREKYLFSRFHFHFGKTNIEGSEHTINSQQYAMEMHFVFYNARYPNITFAGADPKGLAVIGVMFTVSDTASNYGLFEYLPEFKWPNTQKVYNFQHGQEIVDFGSLLKSDYITYQGSLTTPICYEIVTWLIDTKVRNISKRQMNMLRSLAGNEGQMAGNYRPLQPLNTRSCTYYS